MPCHTKATRLKECEAVAGGPNEEWKPGRRRRGESNKVTTGKAAISREKEKTSIVFLIPSEPPVASCENSTHMSVLFSWGLEDPKSVDFPQK